MVDVPVEGADMVGVALLTEEVVAEATTQCMAPSSAMASSISR